MTYEGRIDPNAASSTVDTPVEVRRGQDRRGQHKRGGAGETGEEEGRG